MCPILPGKSNLDRFSAVEYHLCLITSGWSMSRNAWSELMLVVCLLPVACQTRDATPAGWKTHPLGKGQVTVAAPADYRESTEPNETLVLTPPDDPGVTLRFNLHYADGQGVPADVGVQFVRDQAKEKNLSVTEKNAKVFLTETSNDEEDGTNVERRFWQIGFQNAIVVMSATVVVSKKDDRAIKECLESTVPAMIDSLTKP